MKLPLGNLKRLEIEVHRGAAAKGGKVGAITGHTVHHYSEPTSSSKSGAFLEQTHSSVPFGKGQEKAMLAHVTQQLSGKATQADGEQADGNEEDYA